MAENLSMWRESILVAGKDLRIEWRSKVAIGQIAPFALTVLLLFAFALDPDSGMLTRAAAGLFWIAVLLSSVLAVQRSFAVEMADNARDGLRLSGLDPAAIFLGKAAAVMVQLFALEAILAVGVFVLYDVTLHATALLAATCVTATVGLAAAGIIYGVLAAGARGRETLLPLLFVPIVAPVMLCAGRASESALAGAAGEGWPWVRLLTVFALVYSAVGVVVFGPLLEDS